MLYKGGKLLRYWVKLQFKSPWFAVADPEGDPGVHRNPPFWLHLALRSILMLGKMEPPFLATKLRKLLLWLTLECFSLVRKQIGSLSIEVGVVLTKSGRGF